VSVRGRDVLAAIFDGCRGLLELRVLSSDRAFVEPTDIAAVEAFVIAHRQHNVFFGVATRHDASCGTLGNCEQLGAVYADLDCHADEQALADADARLAAFVLAPSIVICSGGGRHVYWLLREPADVPIEAAALRTVLRRIAHALGGDFASAECARVLRLPGSLNHKYDPAVPVTIQIFEADRRYSLSEFDVLPSEPVTVAVSADDVLDLADIRQSKRNSTLYRLGRSLKAKNLPPSAIAGALHAANATCQPAPLDARELDKIIRQVTTQADRPDFEPDVEIELTTSAPVAPVRCWPKTLPATAYCGVAGACVQTLAPHTEADPVALLIHLLVSFGSVIGRSAHWRAESDVHYLNLFAALVGETAKGRKGVSGNHSRHMFRAIDSVWAERCNKSGLSSGEGLIWAVRDPIEKQQPIKEHGRVVEYQTVVEDPGISDKRLHVIEAEFASTLRVLDREGNTLSALLRQAWDGHDLRVLTKNSPATATAPHISTVVNITRDEVCRYLGRTEAGNGFGNRFLWVCVRRSQVLPDGGGTVDWDPLVQEMRATIAHACTVGELRRDPGAADLWHQVYGSLSEGRPGLLGAMTARAEAQVMRLACLYALNERSYVVCRAHLEAALDLWRYCFDSARYIFGDCLGDQTADAILQALRAAGDTGLTRAEILHDVLGRNKPAADITRALGVLAEAQLARHAPDWSGGGAKPADRWFATSKRDDPYDVYDPSTAPTSPKVVNVVNVVAPADDEPAPAWVMEPVEPDESDPIGERDVEVVDRVGPPPITLFESDGNDC
jgi:hypothetical protein